MALLFKPALRQLVQSSQVLTLDGGDDVLAANVETVEHSCELPGGKTISRMCVCHLFEISESQLVDPLLVNANPLVLPCPGTQSNIEPGRL